jgi:CBS domain-containing protein
MVVADFATRNVYTCRTTDSAARAAHLMWEHDCGCIPLVDDSGMLVGLVTDRDLCMAAYVQGRPLDRIELSGLTARSVVTVRGSDPVDTAEALMRKHRVRRVPVVDVDGRPIGILSLSDLATQMHLGEDGLNAAHIVETLAALARPSVKRPPVARPGRTAD